VGDGFEGENRMALRMIERCTPYRFVSEPFLHDFDIMKVLFFTGYI